MKLFFRRFMGLLGAGIIVASSISVSSENGKNCFLGLIKPNFDEKLVKTSIGKFSLAEFYIPAYCYGKNVGAESLYCGGEIEVVYGWTDPNTVYSKPQRLALIRNLADGSLVKNDDWRISKFYNVSLPPAWNSIPIAYRRLVI